MRCAFKGALVTRGSSLFCCVPHPRVFADGAVLNFPCTLFTALNLSLLLTNISHLWYPFVCYLEQTSLGPLPSLPLSPLLASACALFISLCALFPAPILCFQQLPHSFRKTPGV